MSTLAEVRRNIRQRSLKVRFDADEHQYSGGGRVYPSVTQILDAAGFGEWKRAIDPDVLERARQRGTAVHAACEYINEGDLDWDSLDPEIRPYVEAYAEWKEQTAFRIDFVEPRMIHRKLGFAGTADIIGTINGSIAIPDLSPASSASRHRCSLPHTRT